MTSIRLTEETLPYFAYLIPEGDCEDLRNGELEGIGIVDEWQDNAIVAAAVFRDVLNWIEIVWFGVAEDYRGGEYSMEALTDIVRALRQNKERTGIFAELYDEKEEHAMRWLLAENGFSFYPVKSRAYELRVKEVREVAALHMQAGREYIKPLSEASKLERGNVVQALQSDSRPVAIEFPIPFERYDEDLSVLYQVDGKVKGLLLFSREEDAVLMEFAWGSTPMALPTMLGYTLSVLEANGEENTRIVIAAITETTVKLVEKLVPGIQSRTYTQARYYFNPLAGWVEQEEFFVLED